MDTIKQPYYRPIGNEVTLFEQAYRHQLPVLIKGPTGCGKTRFVSYMAAQLGSHLYTVACHDDLTAADLIGRHLIGHESTYWSDGPLTRAVREGAICYLDEVIERTNEVLQAPPEFMLVVSYNPGYQNLLKGMKPSTRQRFVALRFNYPSPSVEQEILIGETDIDKSLAQRLVNLTNALRQLKEHDIEEAASTRLLIYAATLIKHGFEPVDACRAALVEPLSDDIDTVNALMEVVLTTFGK